MKTTGCGLGGRVRKLRRAWPAIMLLVFAIECPSAYADDPKPPNADEPKPPNFVFVDGAAVTLSPDGSDAFKFDIPVKNSGGKGDASLKLLSDKDKGCDQAKVVPEAIIGLSYNAVAITHFEITNVKLPASCYIELVTEGGDGNTSLKQIKLTQKYLTSTVLTPLVIYFLISLAVAVITWIVAAQRLKDKVILYPNFKLGPPSWDFAKSWTSNTTLVGAIISTALTLSALPELTKYASKSGYSTLALLNSLAVIIAPFVFIAFRRGKIGKEDAVLYQGCLWAFLLSCAITLFAALAQLVVLFLLLAEVLQEWSFSESWSLNAGSILTFVLGAALCWYVGNSMYLTIKLQVVADKKEAAKMFKEATDNGVKEGEATEAARGAKGPLLPWPVL
jgi:uncharacterized membrane protein YciS (DUF1049 family)